MSTPDDIGGVLDVIDQEEHVAPQPPEPKTKTEPEPKSAEEPKPKETQTPAESEDDEDEVIIDTQDFTRAQDKDDDEEPVEEEPSPEPSKPKTETEPKADAATEPDWKATIPPPPPEFSLEPPQINEEGQITNMTPAEYQRYIVEAAKHEMRKENYETNIESRALDAAEQLLPEIKTNPNVRKMVENARVASILQGNQIDSYEAAKQVKEALGITTTQLADAKAEGAKNAKVSITIQKAAAVETKGATQKKAQPTKVDKLNKRLSRGDEQAFVELLDIWQEEGKV